MKFDYAPGLPGYGTKGIDGSAGLLGLGLYFAEYDGTTDTTILTSKITNNKLLSVSDVTLPGYPKRIYQTGDYFVDKNGRVYKIDLSLSNKYVYTSTRLDTSAIFSIGPTTSNANVEYTRYSNSYTTDKILLDVVDSATAVSNYALAPSSANGIYGIGAADFAQVKYVDNSVNSYEPFEIWSNTNNVANPEKAIALVKEYGGNTWRFGNSLGGVVRDVSLCLDFKNVNIIGDFRAYGITGANGTTGVTAGTIGIYAGDGGVGSVGYGGDGGDVSINAGDGGSGASDSGNGGNIYITSGNSVDQNAGSITLKTGEGDGDPGTIYLESDDVRVGIRSTSAQTLGTLNGITQTTGDPGTPLEIHPGVGGYSNGDGITGGAGAYLALNGGTGGGGLTGDADGGLGGDVSINGGTGGTPAGGGDGGDGGNVYIAPGKAGNTGGEAGTIYIDTNPGETEGKLYIAGLPTVSAGLNHLAISGTKIYQSTVNVTSDINLKNIINPLDSTEILDKLKSLRGYYWKYNEYSKEIFSKVDTEQQHIGLIAQDVIKVFPEIVSEETGNNKENYYALDYRMFVPILVEAIKEQQSQIEELKNMISKQQEQINQLLNK